MLNIGDKAPLFSKICDDNSILDLSQIRNSNILLYFYPKDDTPGCTIQAQDFTNNLDKFKELDTIIIGISRDDVNSHKKFVEKYNINFNLISDYDEEICKKYDVLKEKSLFGKKYIGIERSTFLIDKKGNLAKIWRKVKVKDHFNDVLNFIENNLF